jgi:hypothetical protein
MIKKLAIGICLVASVAGCATRATYTLSGQKYSSKEDFQQASIAGAARAMSNVSRLPRPLTTKKIVVAIPSEETLHNEDSRRFLVQNGRTPNPVQQELIDNLGTHNFRGVKVFYEAIERRGIYASAQFKGMPTTAVSLEPSADTDVLYFTEPSVGSGQWFYASQKHGKQVFAYDRSAPEGSARVQRFLEAVEAQAIRE